MTTPDDNAAKAATTGHTDYPPNEALQSKSASILKRVLRGVSIAVWAVFLAMCLTTFSSETFGNFRPYTTLDGCTQFPPPMDIYIILAKAMLITLMAYSPIIIRAMFFDNNTPSHIVRITIGFFLICSQYPISKDCLQNTIGVAIILLGIPVSAVEFIVSFIVVSVTEHYRKRQTSA